MLCLKGKNKTDTFEIILESFIIAQKCKIVCGNVTELNAFDTAFKTTKAL